MSVTDAVSEYVESAIAGRTLSVVIVKIAVLV